MKPTLDVVLYLPGGPLMIVAWTVLLVEGSLWALGRLGRWSSRQARRQHGSLR